MDWIKSASRALTMTIIVKHGLKYLETKLVFAAGQGQHS